jgi:ribosomal protein L24
VIAGKDKGTVAEIERVIPTRGMVVVKGVNIKVKPTRCPCVGV